MSNVKESDLTECFLIMFTCERMSEMNNKQLVNQQKQSTQINSGETRCF